MAITLTDLAANSGDKLVQGFTNEIVTDSYLLGAMPFDDCMTATGTSDLFDYQSDRHCAKTTWATLFFCRWFDYQSDRHCAKTLYVDLVALIVFDYQSDRHCAKTQRKEGFRHGKFDYQSDRHCAKTTCNRA